MKICWEGEGSFMDCSTSTTDVVRCEVVNDTIANVANFRTFIH